MSDSDTWGEPLPCNIEIFAARTHTSIKAPPVGGKRASVTHCQRVMWAIHALCQLRNHQFLCVLNRVWPRVKLETSSSHSIMFLRDVLKEFADVSACYLIEYETHASRFPSHVWRAVLKTQSRLSKATDWSTVTCLSLFNHLFIYWDSCLDIWIWNNQPVLTANTSNSGILVSGTTPQSLTRYMPL